MDGEAKGTFNSVYKDLSIKITDKKGETNKLLTMLDNLVIENDNKKEESEGSTAVSIQHTHENGAATFVWTVS